MKKYTTKAATPAYISEADLINRAASALEAKAKRDGFMFEQPSATLSEFDRARSVVILRNCSRVLAVFAYNGKRDRLAWADDQAEGGAA